ncbi:putative Maltose permease [Seiridium unicorne]|uniref:Maltose permease n=1 Tax=Seiridium unicorne TaxID=138068 RepID=A0ABR2URP5_9PEZI
MSTVPEAPKITWFVMTAGLLIIGGISTIENSASLEATVAFMTVWGWLYQATLGAVAYAIGGETPNPSHRQKTYSINIMSATVVSCVVLQIMPYLINTDQANLGGNICFVFFAPSVPKCAYLYFCLSAGDERPQLRGTRGNFSEWSPRSEVQGLRLSWRLRTCKCCCSGEKCRRGTS